MFNSVSHHPSGNGDRRTPWAVALAFLALVAVATVSLGPRLTPPARAAAFATPVASWPHSTDNSKWPVYFWTTEAITTSGASQEWKLANYEALDLHYVIDQGTVNTATLKLQYSNDGSNWADGADVVAANAADANEMVQHYNVGAYTRLYATVSNANPVTVTVIGLAK